VSCSPAASSIATGTGQLLGREPIQGVGDEVGEAGAEQLRALPSDVYAGVVDAFAVAINSVFIWAVPFAALAFGLTLLLRELPLRDTTHSTVVSSSEGAVAEGGPSLVTSPPTSPEPLHVAIPTRASGQERAEGDPSPRR
jgi:hypothetical protein